MSDPTDTFRFYVSISVAGVWSIETLQGWPPGEYTDPKELAEILRDLAHLVEKNPQHVPAIRYPDPRAYRDD